MRSQADLPKHVAPTNLGRSAQLTADGRQALMAAFYTDTFGFFFDAEGNLLEYATRPNMEGRPEGQPDCGPSLLALETWQNEIGFEPRTIRVRALRPTISCRQRRALSAISSERGRTASRAAPAMVSSSA